MRISDWSSDVCSSDLRERGHIAAISAWADGDWAGYKRRLDLVAAEHPRDLLAIQAGHLSDFYHGDRENLRGRIARALRSEGRRVGKGWVSTCRSRWSPYH